MTVLPVKGVLSPDVAELGLSFANVVLAESDEEAEVALSNLKRSIVKMTSAIARQTVIVDDLETILKESSEEDVRTLLDTFCVLETKWIEVAEIMAGIVERLKGRDARTRAMRGDVLDAAQELLNVWRDVHIPLVRRTRLSVIMFVFRRAQARGIPNTQLDAGFEERFLAASPGEVDSWQETAYLLAVPESADRLLRSIGMTSQDKTDQIPGPTG